MTRDPIQDRKRLQQKPGKRFEQVSWVGNTTLTPPTTRRTSETWSGRPIHSTITCKETRISVEVVVEILLQEGLRDTVTEGPNGILLKHTWVQGGVPSPLTDLGRQHLMHRLPELDRTTILVGETRSSNFFSVTFYMYKFSLSSRLWGTDILKSNTQLRVKLSIIFKN